MSALNEPEFSVDFATVEEVTELSGEKEKEELHRADPMNSGFLWYTPPMAAQNVENAPGGSQQWIISGHDMQVLTATVPPGSTVTAEVGSFFFGSKDIETSVEFTCCNGAEGCQRIFGGESCVKLLLTNAGRELGFVGLTPGYPAKIIPIKFGTHVQENHKLIAQPGVYMSQLGDVHVSCDTDCSLTTCCCAGFGCCRLTMSGPKDSIAFFAAGGTLVYRQLKSGERITVDSRSVVAIEESVQLGIRSNGRFCMCCFGGEGCCSTTLTGPGKVFMQSLSFKKFANAVQQNQMDDREDDSST